MVAGGSEASICPMGVAGFTAFDRTFYLDRSLHASRPFDENRDGFVMGEGAGVVVLESLEHALARGAKSMRKWGATGQPVMPTISPRRPRTEAVQPVPWKMPLRMQGLRWRMWIILMPTAQAPIRLTICFETKAN